jgi:hypothetical protein
MATTINPSDQTITQYNIQTGGASNLLNNVAPSATSGVPIISQGSSSQPIFGTAAIGGGGTNATSFGTSQGIVVYNGTSLVNYAGPKISSSGIYTNTTQTAFNGYCHASYTDVTGDGTVYTIIWDTVTYDRGSAMNTSTGLYTIPAAGLYLICPQIVVNNLSASFTIYDLFLIINSTKVSVIEGAPTRSTNELFSFGASYVQSFNASDTMEIQISLGGGTKVVGIQSDDFGIYTNLTITKIA